MGGGHAGLVLRVFLGAALVHTVRSQAVSFACFGGKPLDLIFLVDGSNSMKYEGHFEKVRAVVGDIINNVSLKPGTGDGTIVSLVQFATYVQFQRGMKRSDKKESLLAGLAKMKQYKTGTRLNHALKYVDRFFLADGLLRPNAIPVLIIFSDGNSNDGFEHIYEIHKKGILTIAMGHGRDVNDVLLEKLASKNNYCLPRPNYSAMMSMSKCGNYELCLANTD